MSKRSASASMGMGPGGPSITIPAATGLGSLDGAMSAAWGGSKRGVWQPGPSGLFDMAEHAPDKRRRVENPGGPAMPSTGGPLDGKHVGLFKTPYPRTPIPAPQRVVNQNQPYPRIVKRGAPGMQTIDTVGMNQWVLVHGATGDMTADTTRIAADSLRFKDENGMSLEFNMVPVTALSPQMWNLYMLKVQQAMFDQNPEAFHRLSAADIMKDWSWDGVCVAEEAANGAETATTGGYGPNREWRGGDGYKAITSVLRGETHCYNCFGDSVIAGGALYAIVRKENVPASGFDFEFDVRPHARAPIAHTAPASDRELMEMRARADTVTIGRGMGRAANFKPFMLRMICVPDDSSIPLDYRIYTNENGVIQPSEICYLGKVLIEPHGHRPRPLPSLADDGPAPVLSDKSSASKYGPGVYTGAKDAYDRGLMKVLVNPRGLNPLY